MPSSLGLNLERTLERRACGQFTLRSMKVVLTLCYLACFHLFLHTWRENIFPEAAKWLKSVKTSLMVVMGNGLKSTDTPLQPQVVSKARVLNGWDMSSRIGHQILTHGQTRCSDMCFPCFLHPWNCHHCCRFLVSSDVGRDTTTT